MIPRRKLLLPILLFGLVTVACAISIPRQSRTPAAEAEPGRIGVATVPVEVEDSSAPESGAAVSTGQPVAIRGSFEFSNDIIITYYVEHAVALVDMYAYVHRDEEWEMPVSSQTLGFMAIDEEEMTGTFTLQLPARPTAVQVDVDNDGQQDPGVQVFTVAYFPNVTGGPYSEGDDVSHGWPSYLTSAKTDSENDDEIIGGKLVIWASDGSQTFPSGFGEDGLLFTADDPTMPVPQGYSVVDLDQDPFALIREEEPELTLYEPDDAAIKDFSDLSYQEAFDQMFEIVRTEYAFNGIEGKQPDWDSLYEELSPRVAEASENQDAEEFYRAMRDFVVAFKDGHVGLNGGDVERAILGEQIEGGYGFALRELDDGRMIVVYVLQDGPADRAGIERGAEVTEFNGRTIDEAVAAVEPVTAPHSTNFGRRYDQVQFLVRAPVGTKASVTFENPNEDPRTVQLTTIPERETLSVTSKFRDFDPNALPVEHFVIPGDLGYVKINTNLDDLNLIIRLFERALETFESNDVGAIIIDLRANSGGAPLGLAGYLTNEEIILGQLEYYSEKTGQFEPEGLPDKVTPYERQFRFSKMILLVDQACASACELEAYGFSQVPGMLVVGQYPTAGVEAEVARGQFELPEGMSLQVPTGRFVLPDGSIFLEGQGVVPE
jgi:C-terminal processing protease CtpA/Prc